MLLSSPPAAVESLEALSQAPSSSPRPLPQLVKCFRTEPARQVLYPHGDLSILCLTLTTLVQLQHFYSLDKTVKLT